MLARDMAITLVQSWNAQPSPWSGGGCTLSLLPFLVPSPARVPPHQHQGAASVVSKSRHPQGHQPHSQAGQPAAGGSHQRSYWPQIAVFLAAWAVTGKSLEGDLSVAAFVRSQKVAVIVAKDWRISDPGWLMTGNSWNWALPALWLLQCSPITKPRSIHI